MRPAEFLCRHSTRPTPQTAGLSPRTLDRELPHARTEHVRSIVVVVGRSERGILFDHDQEDVRPMFRLGTPKSKPGGYLQVLGAFCKLLKDDANHLAFLAAAAPEDFVRAVFALVTKLRPPA